MEHPSTPAGGQPANLRAGTPATFNPTAEAARLRKTIVLAAEAIREACTLRSAAQPGETAGDAQERWNNAHRIETAAVACRKAARAALGRVTGFISAEPEQVAARIETARAEALALKHAIDLERRDNVQRQIRLAARDLKRQIADCHAIAEGAAAKAAEAARVSAEYSAKAAALRSQQEGGAK